MVQESYEDVRDAEAYLLFYQLVHDPEDKDELPCQRMDPIGQEAGNSDSDDNEHHVHTHVVEVCAPCPNTHAFGFSVFSGFTPKFPGAVV